MAEKPALKPAVYAVAKAPEGFLLQRDGVPLNTPGGVPFLLPAANLAEAIADEWRAQGLKPSPATMPLTQLVATSLDIVPKDREKIVDEVACYGRSELLCHRAEEPAELVRRQQEIWQPVLDWCARRFDALLQSGAGIMPITQPPEVLQALRKAVAAYDGFHLAGLAHAVHMSGSLVLGLALAEGHLSAEQVFTAAELDAAFQAEKWGADPAAEARWGAIRRDLAVCEKWFRLLKS